MHKFNGEWKNWALLLLHIASRFYQFFKHQCVRWCMAKSEYDSTRAYLFTREVERERREENERASEREERLPRKSKWGLKDPRECKNFLYVLHAKVFHHSVGFARYLNNLEWIFHHHRSVINQIIAEHIYKHTYVHIVHEWRDSYTHTLFTTSTQQNSVVEKIVATVLETMELCMQRGWSGKECGHCRKERDSNLIKVTTTTIQPTDRPTDRCRRTEQSDCEKDFVKFKIVRVTSIHRTSV